MSETVYCYAEDLTGSWNHWSLYPADFEDDEHFDMSRCEIWWWQAARDVTEGTEDNDE